MSPFLPPAWPSESRIISRSGHAQREGALGRNEAENAPGAVRQSRFRAAARLGNRLGEESYRQLVSWYYQLRGFVVLYDRHFLFDFAPEIVATQPMTLEQRLHSWWLATVYPRPNLIIYLDAPGEVLFARKGESTVVELERRRQAFLRFGQAFPNFVRVDATQRLADVYDEIVHHVLNLAEERLPQAALPAR